MFWLRFPLLFWFNFLFSGLPVLVRLAVFGVSGFVWLAVSAHLGVSAVVLQLLISFSWVFLRPFQLPPASAYLISLAILGSLVTAPDVLCSLFGVTRVPYPGFSCLFRLVLT